MGIMHALPKPQDVPAKAASLAEIPSFFHPNQPPNRHQPLTAADELGILLSLVPFLPAG
jgi:hypothetical protein